MLGHMAVRLMATTSTDRRRQARGTPRRVRAAPAVLFFVLALSVVRGVNPAFGASPEPSASTAPAKAATLGRVPFSNGLRNPYGDSGITAVAHGPAGYVAVGWGATGDAAWWSADGLRWERSQGPEDWVHPPSGESRLRSVAATSQGYLAGGTDDGTGTVWVSPDGRAWSKAAGGLDPGVAGIVEHDGTLYALAGSNAWASTDGNGWQQVATFPTSELRTISAGPAGLLIVGQAPDAGQASEAVATHSDDGVTWDMRPMPDPEVWLSDATAFGDGWLAIGYVGGERFGFSGGSPAVWRSGDGRTWERAPDVEFDDEVGVGFGAATETPDGGALIAGGRKGQLAIWTSSDGATWDQPLEPAGPGAFRGTYEATDATSSPGGAVIVGSYPDREPGAPWTAGDRSRSAAVWMTPAPPQDGVRGARMACPHEGADVAAILDLEPGRRAACFGHRDVTFGAYVLGSTGGACIVCTPPEPR